MKLKNTYLNAALVRKLKKYLKNECSIVDSTIVLIFQ